MNKFELELETLQQHALTDQIGQKHRRVHVGLSLQQATYTPCDPPEHASQVRQHGLAAPVTFHEITTPRLEPIGGSPARFDHVMSDLGRLAN